MSKRRSVRKTPGQANAIISMFKDIRFDFVLAVIIAILYISASVKLSADKVLILILGPVIAELALLGIDRYIFSWIKSASPVRSLITSAFGIAIGLTLVLANGVALIGGIVVIILSVLLIVYCFWKYRSTRDFGIKGSNPIGTINTALFLAGLLLWTLGYGQIFLVIIGCSLIVLVHTSLPFSIFLTIIMAAVMQTVLGSVLYAIVVVCVEGVVQGYLNRVAFINRIKNASSLRTLITSVFGVVIGSALVLVSEAALVEGIIIIILSVLLTIYGVRRYMATRDLGITNQDPIATANMVILFTSLLMLVLGILSLFAVLISCWAMIFFYRQMIFEIPIMLFAAVMVQGLLIDLAYTLTIIVVGMVMAALGIFLKRREAEKVKSVAKAKSAASKEKR